MQEPIVVTISREKSPYVSPYRIHVHPGDVLKLKTDGDTSAAVVLPSVKLYSDVQRKDNYHQFVLGRDSEITVEISRYATQGWFTFHVFIPEIKEFADDPGHSAPIIIIE